MGAWSPGGFPCPLDPDQSGRARLPTEWPAFFRGRGMWPVTGNDNSFGRPVADASPCGFLEVIWPFRRTCYGTTH